MSSGYQYGYIISGNEISEHLKNDGRHTASRMHPPQIDPHLKSELWHIMLNKYTCKTLKKRKGKKPPIPLKHCSSQSDFVPGLVFKNNWIFTKVQS